MPNSQPIQLSLQVSAGEEADAEELDRLTRQLRSEILDLPEIESVELAKGERPHRGTKVADPVTLGVLAVAVLPTFLPKLVDFVQAWALRGQGRSVKFKGKVSGQAVEFEGTADELKDLITTLKAPPARKSRRVTRPK